MKKEPEIEATSGILGIHFDTSGNDAIKKKIEENVYSEGLTKIFTPNAEIITKAVSSRELKELINSAEIVLPDGVGIVLASKLLHGELQERFAGIDMGEYVLSLANERGLRVFLLGGKEGVAELAAKNLSKKYPKVSFCGTHHGYFDKEGYENDTVILKIKASVPHIIFVCFGFPHQEKWIKENLKDIPSLRIAAGLGGSLDVWSGRVRRAPGIFKRFSLEWLWRMISQPKKIKFLLSLPSFFIAILRERKRISTSLIDSSILKQRGK